jgi:signal transduction histidine kinase
MASAIRRAMATGEAVVDWTVTLKPPPGGGQVRHFLLSAVPLPDRSGKPRAVGVVLAEVTRIKEAEETLIRQAAFRERYMGVLAHDLRSPLHAIEFSARTLLQQPDAPAVSLRVASRIQRAASRMTKMVSDLLDLTRAREGGGIAVTPAPADLAEIARVVLTELEAAHPGREIRLSVVGDGRADLDQARMAQVVSNLVGNALAYSPAGTPVEVRITGDADAVALAVHNLGAPIPAEGMATLFEPFRRAHAEDSEEPAAQGLGLGLFIVREVVQAHGGSVSATSSLQAGTTFTVRLPRHGAIESAARAA